MIKDRWSCELPLYHSIAGGEDFPAAAWYGLWLDKAVDGMEWKEAKGGPRARRYGMVCSMLDARCSALDTRYEIQDTVRRADRVEIWLVEL